MSTITFTVVAEGWQPVADETQITIGSTSGLKMKQYVIHCGSGGTDYYAFFGSENAPLKVSLAGNKLAVTGAISYIQQIEKDGTKENTYKAVGSKLMFDDAITGGFQLTQRFIIADDYGGKPFGKTMLNVSNYASNKVVFIAGAGTVNIKSDSYDQFFKNAFTIMPLPALTEAITPTTDILYITNSASEFKTTQSIAFDNLLPHDFTIGGSTGITVSGFTQTAANGTDNHLVVLLTDNKHDIHGRTQPVIKFVDGTTTATVDIRYCSELAGFVKPVNVVESITYKFLAGKSGTSGMVMVDATNLGKIVFDTASKLTIPESSIEPTLTAPTAAATQLFQLNIESVVVPAEGVYYFSLATIDNSTSATPKLAPLAGTLNTTTYDFASNDAVYIVRFKLGAEQTDKFPATAQVVGKIIISNIAGSFAKVPLELTQLGDDAKHQLVYINIGASSTALTTVEHAYALPYDGNTLKSSALKAAGVSAFPSSVDTENNVINCNNYFYVEFSKGTEDMFKKFAAEDEEKKTNIFATTITDMVFNCPLNIYNHIDWSKLGFDLNGEGKPIYCDKNDNVVKVFNIDEGYITADYFLNPLTSINNGNMQHIVFNVNSVWKQSTAADAFGIDATTAFGSLSVSTTDKLMKIGESSPRYFALFTNTSVVSPSDIEEGNMTIDIELNGYPSYADSIAIYELKATEEAETRAITYSAKQVGTISYNNFNIGLSSVYKNNELITSSYSPSFVFAFDRIGTIHNYTEGEPPTTITSEADMPDYILKLADLKTREDLQSFDLMWLVKNISALDIKGFTPSAARTIESKKEFTIAVNNHVDWSATNKLTLKGGKWIVNDLSASPAGSIVVNNSDGSSVIAKGWQNKYLSQLGAPSSIQKNLQTIYDALGNVVQRVPINNTVEYAFNVNGIADDTMKQFETLITSLLKTQVHGSDNRISQYTIEVVTPGGDDFGKVAVKFSLPSKDGKNTKEITADVSLNIITDTNAEEGTKENDYYVMYYNSTSKAIKFVKSNDMSTALDANVYDGVALKLIKTSSDSEGKLRLFFNNSSVVITTPLFVDDFNEGTPTAAYTEQPAITVNGRIVYKLEGIENLVLVDTVNVSGMTIE